MRVLWMWSLLSLSLVRESAATNIHVRVHHRHHKPTRAFASDASTTADDAATGAQRVTCPTSDSALAQVTTPALTTACPSSCSAVNLCIYYPKAFDSQCATTARRTCYHGDTCAFQCVPNADRLNGWFLSLYTDPTVVDQVNIWNDQNKEIRSVAVNISLVSQWAGRVTLPNGTAILYITGNEAANDVILNDDAHYYQDMISLSKGDIIPFELPTTLYEDAQQLQYMRLENLKAPAVTNSSKLVYPQLVELYMRNTMLTTFPLPHASFPVLEAVDVSVNNLTEIPRSALPDTLTVLNVSFNAISQVKKGSLPNNLTIVDLASNGITQISKDTLPLGITQLFLDGNSMTEIPPDVAGMQGLTKLFLDGNMLKEIPASALPPLSMNSLSLINCSLTSVPSVIKAMTGLTEMNLGSNDFSRDPDFSLLPKSLTLLNIDNCRLEKFPKTFQNLPKLQTLSICGNPKAVLDMDVVPPGLTTLILNDNALEAVPNGVKDLNLVYLEIESNPLGQLAPGSLPDGLNTIYFSNGAFTTIKAGTLPDSITDLSIVDSALQVAPEDIRVMRNLFVIGITNCSLDAFDVANGLPELNTLDLSDNRIKRFTGRYAALTYLDLRHNALQEFNLTYAPVVQTLHLAENNLTTFPSCIFNMNELLLLNLTRNPIRNFTPDVDQFAALSRITNIVLDQEMFATNCDPSSRMQLRGYTVCSPNSTNAANLQELKGHTSKMSAGLVLLNVCLAVALALLVATAWRRRKLQKQRLRDLDSKTASLEKMQRHQSSATIWSDTVLVQNRLDEDLVERKRLLGSGMYGEVWLVLYKNERFALKQLKQPSDSGAVIDRHLINDFVEEIKLLSSLTHPSVVRFVGVVWTKESDIAMLTEYMDGGDLRSYLDNNPKVDNGWTVQMARVALNITEAIVYLHSLDPIVIHRDLKSRNVLLDKSMRAKLSDFGISRYKLDDDTMTAAVGTIRWVAPEVLVGKRYDESVDIYSLGIILSEIDTHKLPFDDLTDETGHDRLTDSAIAGLLLSGSLTSSFSESCPSEIKSLAERCTAFDPTDRPTGLQVAYELRTMLKNSSSFISSSGKFHSFNGIEDDQGATSRTEEESHTPSESSTHVSI